MTIMMIFVVVSVIAYQIQVETTASSYAFDNNDEITKTDISISGINASSGSKLVNFTMTNVGSEKLWNYDDFDILITYDANILGKRTPQTEQFTYNALAFEISTGKEGDSPDFNVQRGCTTIPDGNFDGTLNAGVDYVAPTGEAFVRIVNTRLTGNGNDSGYNNPWAVIEDFGAFVRVVDFPTQIIFTRNANPVAEDTQVCYEIIDYVGLPDSDNAIQVLDQNFVTYTTGLTAVSGPSVTPTDDADVVVFITGQAGEENISTQWGETLSTASWDDVNDQAVFTRGEASGSEDDNDLSYAIVEFTGINWKIQRFQHTYIGTAPEIQNITPLGSLSKAFLHTQHSSGTDTGLDTQGEEAWLSATDEITFDLETNANFGGVVTVAWVIENLQNSGTIMNSQHLSGSRAANFPCQPLACEPDTWTETIPTPVLSTTNTAIMGENNRSFGGGIAYPRGAIALELTADDTITLTRTDTGQNQNYRFSVVEFPHTVKCIKGTSNNIAVNEWTINCIKFDYFEPDVVNPNESPEILTKLQYPLFTNGLLNISVSTDKGITVNQTTTVS